MQDTIWRTRDCTGAYVKKAGGWFTKLAEKMKPRQKVGEVFTEEDLQKLWSRPNQ